ncbi:MAG: TRAP transporter small permease subunit [Roseovarius sp.]
MQKLRRIADGIDRFTDRLGNVVSWLVGVMVVVCAAVALLRYILGVGWVWMQDIYIWSNAIVFMLGAAPTLLHDKHVRVDFIYGARSRKYRAWVDILGSIFLLAPSLAVIAVLSAPYVSDSWARFEGTLDVGGLPGVFVLKSVLLLFCLPLAAQGVSKAIRSYFVLTGHDSEGLCR